jgi:hypothetical protein
METFQKMGTPMKNAIFAVVAGQELAEQQPAPSGLKDPILVRRKGIVYEAFSESIPAVCQPKSALPSKHEIFLRIIPRVSGGTSQQAMVDMRLVPHPMKEVVENSPTVEVGHGDRVFLRCKLPIAGLSTRKPERHIGNEERYEFFRSGPIKMLSLGQDVCPSHNMGRP